MPPGGIRGRRGRGRGAAKRENSGRPHATQQPTETESQQQQQSSNNKAPPGRESDVRQEEKLVRAVSNRKGTKRPGRPSGRGRNRRGRGTDRTCSETQTSDDEDASNRKGADTATHESSAGESSGHEMEGGETGTSARQGSRKARKKTATTRRSALEDGSEMDVESEGENVVSENQERAAFTDVDERKSTLDGGSGALHASDFPFAVFKDRCGVLRAKHATFVLPICIGSVAFWLGKKAPEKKCYHWVVYVRSPGGVDLSHVIRRVKFQLHPSFSDPERNVDKPPYQLEESGWGEFEILVSIEFREDAAGPPVDVTHSLKLYTTSEPSTKKPVVNEKYDEIVFSEPPAAFLQRVRNLEDHRAPPYIYESCFPQYSCHLADDCMHRIDLVRSKIRNEMRTLMAKAEANGIQIDIPVAMKMIERSPVKDEPVSTASTSHGVRFTPEMHTKTRIIIDADNKDMPLSLETEQYKQKCTLRSDKHLGNEGIHGMEAAPQLLPAHAPKQETRTECPPIQEKSETAAFERGQDVMEIDEHCEDATGDTALPEGAPFTTDRSNLKASAERQRPEIYGDASSTGECHEHTAERRRGSAMQRHPSLPPVRFSQEALHDHSSPTDNSPKESGSSYGAASGT